MQYITRECPHCGYTFERLKPNYIALGNPYKKCPVCNNYVIFNNFNEWEIMSFWKKFKYIWAIFWSILTRILMKIVVGLIVIVILSNYLEIFNILLESNIKFLFIAGIILYEFIKWIKLGKNAINESKKRTQDEEYLNKLYILQKEKEKK